MVAQPLRHLVDDGNVFRLCAFVTPGPSVDLSAHEPRGLAQITEADGLVVDIVQVGECINQHFADATIDVRVVSTAELGRNGAAHDDAAPALHDEERRANDRRVFAKYKSARCKRVALIEHGERAKLATHVVRRRRNGSQRRPGEPVLRRAVAQELSEIRVAAGKLNNLEWTLVFGQLAFQVVGQPRTVEILTVPNRDRFGRIGGRCDVGLCHSRSALRSSPKGRFIRLRDQSIDFANDGRACRRPSHAWTLANAPRSAPTMVAKPMTDAVLMSAPVKRSPSKYSVPFSALSSAWRYGGICWRAASAAFGSRSGSGRIMTLSRMVNNNGWTFEIAQNDHSYTWARSAISLGINPLPYFSAR